MRGKTFSNITQRVVKLLSQVYGTSVQRYSEPRIQEFIQSRFELLFDEYWWKQYCSSGTYTLDGATGTITTDMSTLIKRYEDIQSVFPINRVQPLPQIPDKVNSTLIAGSVPKFIEAVNDAAKVFRVLPITATGDVFVKFRTLPGSFTDNDVIDFDDWLLIYGSVYDYLVDDGTNPGQIEKYQTLFMKRLEQQVELMNIQRIPINYQQTQTTSDQWIER